MVDAAIKNIKNFELKKHVSAIHCSNSLTLVQRKLFNALLFNAYPHLPYKHRFEIKGKDLYNLIGYNSKDTAKLKEALLGLITIAIEWNIIDCSTGQEKKWKASSILASAELSNGICIYEYSQVMKELLYQPEIYGQLNIKIISQFKSSYGLALYENCIRYKSLTQTPWFPLEIFRKLMGVFDGKYQAFKDFKKRVLDIGIIEVNTLSPIRVIPEIERTNQKVTKIRFKLEKNCNSLPVALEDIALDKELNLILINTFGFSEKMIVDTYAKYDLAYVREKIQLITQSENFITGKIRGLAGYLSEALKKDYQLSKSSKAVVNQLRLSQEATINAKKEKEDNRSERYRQYVNKKINIFLTNLAQEKYDELIAEFEEFMKDQSVIIQNWYKKHRLEHPATKSCFYNFIKANKQNKTGTIISLEDYIELID